MKRLLSIIIATAMLISFVPVFSASAEGEAVAEAETISYKINRASVSKAPFEGTHCIPLETDETSENYGKLKFTASDGTITYADNTIYNVLLNFWSDFTKKSTSADLAYMRNWLVSYRELTYYQFTNNLNEDSVTWWPIRSFIFGYNKSINSSYAGSSWGTMHSNKVPIAFTMPASLDLSKTAPFELMGSMRYQHSTLKSNGYEGTFVVGTNDDADCKYQQYKDTDREFNFAMRIKIPEDAVAGKYNLRLGCNSSSGEGYGYYYDSTASTNDVFVFKVPETGMEGLHDNIKKGGATDGGLCGFCNSSGDIIDRETYINDQNFVGQYRSVANSSTTFDEEFTFAPGEEYIIYMRMAENSINIGEDGRATNVYYRDDVTPYQNFRLSYVDLVPVDADYDASFDAVEESYTTSGTATVNTYAYTDGGTLIETIETNVVKNLGEKYTYIAPEKEGYNFLYWAKGASNDKIIVSYSKDLTYKPAEGANYLIAVYESAEGATAKAEFYNANGDRLEVKDSVVFPTLPSLAGYGKATGWYCYNDGKLYAGTETDIELSGTMIFVAKYTNAPATIKVTNAETTTDYAYGELVTFTADEDKIFKGWKKDGEIVSVSKTYSFYAYKDCTVEPIYADEAPNFTRKFIKIIIDTFSSGDATSIMAEFIGLSDAVEKGIILNGTRKIPMKTDSTQFTIEADVDGTYEGYAIVKDGTSFTQVTDGSEEVK